MAGKRQVPLWLKIAYSAMVVLIAPIYWREYGPGNFLWFSDIALFVMVPALWLESRFLASMMAVAVLPLELFWLVSFVTGGMFGLAAYMFAPTLPLYLRALSLFHIPMPAVILFMLVRFGYDTRALWAQTGLALLVLPASYGLTGPTQNINWVYGPGMVQNWIPPWLYLGLMMIAIPPGVYWPTHAILKRVFGPRHARPNLNGRPENLTQRP